MAQLVILEDDLKLAEQLKALLEVAGHKVAVFPTTGEAISHFESNKVDLLIADLFIKDKANDVVFGGISLISHVRQIMKLDLPIIAISGSFSTDIKLEAIQTAKTVGATDVLAKPFHPDELEQMAMALLANRDRQRRERDARSGHR